MLELPVNTEGNVKEKDEAEPHVICDDHRSVCAAKVEERFCHFPSSPKRSVLDNNNWDI